jgi:hypothetical protein
MVGSNRSGTPRPEQVLERLSELKRRTAGAAKTASDAKATRTREMWRDSKRRQRANAVQTRTASRDARVTTPIPSFDELFGTEPASKPLIKKESATRVALEKLSRDKRAPASARVTALRTIAELDGHIGRLQTTAADVSDAPLSTMTREQLENELLRLRANAAQQDAQPVDNAS